MQLKEKANPGLFVESSTGEIYTNPLTLFSSILTTKKENLKSTFNLESKQALSEKSPIGKSLHSKNLIGARFYDPLIGVWISPDPAKQFFNPYSYGGDPVNGVDPNGEFLTFSFSGGGFSIGFNLAPIKIPWGAGINVGLAGDGSIGGYTELGYRSLVFDGGTVRASLDYGFGGAGFNGNVNASAGFNFGSIGFSTNASLNHNITHNKFGGLSIGADAGLGVKTFYSGGGS